MRDLAYWLEELGMSENAQHFAENRIRTSVLNFITDQDLEEIAVLLGHRRKMLAAIATLEGGSAPSAQASESPSPIGRT
jgi:hypothetical protein